MFEQSPGNCTRDRRFQLCVNRIYDAGLGNGGWRAALNDVADLCGASAAMVISRPHPTGPPVFMQDYGIDPAAWGEYEAHYWQHDLWAAGLDRAGWNFGVVMDARQVISDGSFDKSAWYSEFLDAHDTRHGLIGLLSDRTKEADSITCLRAKRASEFDQDAYQILQDLLPHVRRSLTLHRRLKAVQTELTNALDALDRLPDGIIIVDRDRRIKGMNRAARYLLDRGEALRAANGRLRVDDSNVQDQLDRALGSALKMRRRRASELLVPRRAQNGAYALQVLPVPSDRENDSGEDVTALVKIRDPEAVRPPPSRTLAQVYGLTPAESTMAVAIGTGGRVEGYADEAGVTLSTARWRLKQVLAKTGTHRQAELVRLVTSLSSPGA